MNRTRRPPVRAAAACAMLLALASCGAAPKVERDRTFAGGGPTFGAEERRVAATLSLGAGSGLDEEGSPYAQALACKVAYDDVRKQVDQPGRLGAEQLRAMKAAGEVFSRRLASFAASAGKSAAEVARDTSARAAASIGTEANGRLLIACLRKLQEDARR